MEWIDPIIKISALLAALAAICGVICAVVKWFQKQDKQTTDIEELKKLHEKDIEEMRKKEREELQAVKDELCLLSYAMLAALDGLKQQGCNGEVTKAHDKLGKHLNQRAHGQNSSGG